MNSISVSDLDYEEYISDNSDSDSDMDDFTLTELLFKILKHVTLNNKTDSIESENHYIQNAVTLKQFVQISHQLIKDGKLSINNYLKSANFNYNLFYSTHINRILRFVY
eukprot:308751_1